METITIIRPQQVRAHEPRGQILPVGNYMKLEDKENPGSVLLISRKGFVFEVDEEEISEAMKKGYVK